MKPVHPTFQRVSHRSLAALLTSLVLALLLAGCGSDGPATSAAMTQAPPSTTIGAGATPGSSGESATGSTSASPPTSLTESGKYGQQLIETSRAAAALGGELEKKNTQDQDLVAQIYGLRARGQAIVAVRALLRKEPQLADDAVLQMRQLLNRAVGSGSTTWRQLLENALAGADQIPAPSSDSEAARVQLDALCVDLAPLIPTSATGSDS